VKVAFATAELSPWFKVGGLADVSSALPRALARRGHDIRVFVPMYDLVGASQLGAEPVESVQEVLLPIGDREDSFHLFERSPREPGQPRIYFVQCAPFFERGGQVYTWHEDESRRFVFFMRAIVESLQRLHFAPDIVHANDWSTGLLPLFLKTRYAWDALFHHTRTVFTIHNLAYQGVFGADLLADLDLGGGISFLDQTDLQQGRVNFLKNALQLSDRLTTVSPTYAEEIQTPTFGADLDELLRERREDLVGILNGVDTEVWHPRCDPLLPVRYDVDSLWRKIENKIVLLDRAGLEPVVDRPVFGIIARLVEQKGIDLLAEVIEDFLISEDAAIVVLGQGEKKYQDFFADLAQRLRERVCIWPAFDEGFAHLIEAGSDFFLMPSRFEPCGLNQMYSQLYGTIPVVHRSGGLADTVTQFDSATGEGSGVVFSPATSSALKSAMEEAVAIFAQPENLERLRRNCMEQNWSWERGAESYTELYESLMAGA
jgi:starch synthase